MTECDSVLEIGNDYTVRSFREKSAADNSMINAGYMVFQPEIFDYLKDDSTIFEQEPFQMLVENNQLMSYVHKGFWQCMDTQHEKIFLRRTWYRIRHHGRCGDE